MKKTKWNNYGTFIEPNLSKERSRRRSNIIQFLIGKLIRRSNKILDLGTGEGLVRKALEEKNDKTIIGIDKESRILKYKKNVVIGDVTYIPFKDNTFDLIICNGVYQYIKDKDKLIREISRILKGKRYLYLVTPLKYSVTRGSYDLYFLDWLPRKLADIFLYIFKGIKGYKVYVEPHSKMEQRLSLFFEVEDLSSKLFCKKSPLSNNLLKNIPTWLYTSVLKYFNPNIKLLCKKYI